MHEVDHNYILYLNTNEGLDSSRPMEIISTKLTAAKGESCFINVTK